MGDELTPKQAEFVRQYLIDLNAKQAAIRAGYSENTAEMQGSRLMSYAKVQQAVAEGQKQKAAKSARTALDVLEDIQACTREARAMGDLKTAFRGLELEGKHIGMFTEKIEHSGEINTPVLNLVLTNGPDTKATS